MNFLHVVWFFFVVGILLQVRCQEFSHVKGKLDSGNSSISKLHRFVEGETNLSGKRKWMFDEVSRRRGWLFASLHRWYLLLSRLQRRCTGTCSSDKTELHRWH
jgi:hypothetical protein